MTRRILIAMDDTAASVEAAAAARALFGEDDIEYLAINVLKPIVALGASEFGYLPIYPLRGADEDAAACSAQTALSAGVDDAHLLTEVGDPVSAIAAAAAARSVDVIVVGCHHRGLLGRLFDPSVSHGVLRRSTCPVLVVPERAAQA